MAIEWELPFYSIVVLILSIVDENLIECRKENGKEMNVDRYLREALLIKLQKSEKKSMVFTNVR